MFAMNVFKYIYLDIYLVYQDIAKREYRNAGVAALSISWSTITQLEHRRLYQQR